MRSIVVPLPSNAIDRPEFIPARCSVSRTSPTLAGPGTLSDGKNRQSFPTSEAMDVACAAIGRKNQSPAAATGHPDRRSHLRAVAFPLRWLPRSRSRRLCDWPLQARAFRPDPSQFGENRAVSESYIDCIQARDRYIICVPIESRLCARPVASDGPCSFTERQ